MPTASSINWLDGKSYEIADKMSRNAVAFDFDGSSKNKFKIPKRIGTTNSNAAQIFTQGGVRFTCNLDGTITAERVSANTSSIQVWLYDDTSAILLDDWCDGSYYFCPGFTGSGTTARMRLAKIGGGGDHMTVESDVLIPDRGTYTGINVSIMAYSGLTGPITIRPMVIKDYLYNISPSYTPQHPSVAEIWQMVVALQSGTRSAPTEINMDENTR